MACIHKHFNHCQLKDLNHDRKFQKTICVLKYNFHSVIAAAAVGLKPILSRPSIS
jgi:hypothetical protein